jgi:hypothetical protein
MTTSPLTPIAHVIMNQDSGANDKVTLTTEIEAAFATYGWQVELVLAGRQDLRSRTQPPSDPWDCCPQERSITSPEI